MILGIVIAHGQASCSFFSRTRKNNPRFFVMVHFVYDAGGRKAAGFKGAARDCVCRAVAIASGLDYASIYAALARGNGQQRGGCPATVRLGINAKRAWFKDYMRSLGFFWTPTVQIGTGCTVHLLADELPSGRLVVSLSCHYAAVVDGILHDTHDSSRSGSRCVYGYWRFEYIDLEDKDVSL